MKNIMKKILVFVLSVMAFSCSDPDNAIYDVFDGLEHGAIIRTTNYGNADFNLFDLSSTWDIDIETQDEEFGALLESVNVYMSYTDNKDDGANNSKAETLFETIPASAFTTTANGLPGTHIEYSFGELLSALGLSAGQYNGGDTFNVRVEIVLTDGRTFSAADGSGSLQGSYFKSPYTYRIGILCIPVEPFHGDYEIDMQDSWGDGWNGASLEVTIDGVATNYTITGASGSETVNVPVGTATLSFIFRSGDWDGEITFQIYTPSGALGGDYGPTPQPDTPIALYLCDESNDT